MESPKILFEDPHLIVLSKPAGLLSQSDVSGVPSLVDWLRKHVGRNYVGLIHRLDRNTSGIMIVAKRTKAASRLSVSLQEGKLNRVYIAWIEGDLAKPKTWTHWLVKNEKTNEVRVVQKGFPLAKEAILKAAPIKRGWIKKQPVTLAEFKLETGRSHQIRVQSAKEGHPVLGDIKYGNKKNPVAEGIKRPALHSLKLSFPHPMSGEEMCFEAPLPADFKKLSALVKDHRD